MNALEERPHAAAGFARKSNLENQNTQLKRLLLQSESIVKVLELRSVKTDAQRVSKLSAEWLEFSALGGATND